MSFYTAISKNNKTNKMCNLMNLIEKCRYGNWPTINITKSEQTTVVWNQKSLQGSTSHRYRPPPVPVVACWFFTLQIGVRGIFIYKCIFVYWLGQSLKGEIQQEWYTLTPLPSNAAILGKSRKVSHTKTCQKSIHTRGYRNRTSRSIHFAKITILIGP